MTTPKTTPPPTPLVGQRPPGATPQKSSKGCFFWGCIVMISMAIVGILAIWLIIYGVREKVKSIVSDTPADINVYQPTEEEIRSVNDKFADLEAAIKKGEARTVSITADDLNTLVATREDLSDLKGKVFFRIEEDILSARGSIPLAWLEDIPLIRMIYDFEGKHFNGDMDLRITNNNERLQIYIQDIRIKEEPLSEDIMKEIRRNNVMDEMQKQQDPKFREALGEFEKMVESIEVRDGKLIVRTKDNPDAPEAPKQDQPPPGDTPPAE